MTDVGEYRLFVALTAPEPVRGEVEKAQAELRRCVPRARVTWTRREQFHLTLKFLGNVAGERVGQLVEAARGCLPRVRGPAVARGGGWVLSGCALSSRGLAGGERPRGGRCRDCSAPSRPPAPVSLHSRGRNGSAATSRWAASRTLDALRRRAWPSRPTPWHRGFSGNGRPTASRLCGASSHRTAPGTVSWQRLPWGVEGRGARGECRGREALSFPPRHSTLDTRHSTRDVGPLMNRLLTFVLYFAAGREGSAWGQVNYATPYTFQTIAGNAGYGTGRWQRQRGALL